jgi:hypothetical protein
MRHAKQSSLCDVLALAASELGQPTDRRLRKRDATLVDEGVGNVSHCSSTCLHCSLSQFPLHQQLDEAFASSSCILVRSRHDAIKRRSWLWREGIKHENKAFPVHFPSRLTDGLEQGGRRPSCYEHECGSESG